MAGSLKIRLVYICFPTFFQLPDKCNHICVAFLEIYSLNLLLRPIWLKELLLHKGSVKMDENYGVF